MESKEKSIVRTVALTTPGVVVRAYGIIRAKGARRTVVDLPYDGVVFEVGIPLDEVRELQRMMFPWELGLHVFDEGNRLVYKEATPLNRAIMYILARRGGATVEEAQHLALSLLSSELVAFPGNFLTRMRWCRLEGSNCRRILDAFSKMARIYASIV
mgnify:CR=1 FL=1